MRLESIVKTRPDGGRFQVYFKKGEIDHYEFQDRSSGVYLCIKFKSGNWRTYNMRYILEFTEVK